jgi:hypothetical protein
MTPAVVIAQPNTAEFNARYADLATLNTVAANLRAYQNGTLVLGAPQSIPYNMTSPSVDTLYSALLQEYLEVDMTQCVSPVKRCQRWPRLARTLVADFAHFHVCPKCLRKCTLTHRRETVLVAFHSLSGAAPCDDRS